MPHWDTSCLDWETRLREGRSLVPTLPLFKDQAARALRVFGRLMMPDVRLTPSNAAAAGPWLTPVVEALFGSYDEAADRRMISELFLMVPKKNGKTSSAAHIMLTALIVNQRPEAELTLVAPTKDIADRAFKYADGSIRLDPELVKLFHVQSHIRQIRHRQSGAALQVKAADTDVITGVKSTFTLVDETHVFSERSNAEDIFIEIRGALASRPDGFLVQITTQSKKPPAGVFKAELHRARDVRDGKLSRPLLPVLYEFPTDLVDGEAWKDRQYWWMVNPNLGRSVDEDFLQREVADAVNEGIDKQALVASQHFNVEIGISLRTNRWPGAEYWEAAAEDGLTLDTLLERSDCVVVGLDGGGLDDLFGVAVLGREKGTGTWLAWSHAWCHHSVLVRRKVIAQRLHDFADAGELTICEDDLEDITEFVALTKRVKDAGLLGGVAMDPANVGEIVDALDEIDVKQENKLLVGVGQGFRMMNAIKTAERRLVKRTLRHSGSAMMAWCVGNLRIEPTATAIRATKMHAGDAKIDAAMALFDAVELMSLNPTAKRDPSYQLYFA